MKVLIIEDEGKARSLLMHILSENCPFVTKVFEAPELLSGVELIKTHKPSLVFLDIEMPGEQGIEIFKYFKKNEITFEIVFTTAYDRFALQAFEMNAVDYILKPLRPKRVVEVTEKVYASLQKEKINHKLEELRNTLMTKSFSKIGLPMSDGILFLQLDEIIHMEADGMYTRFYTLENGEKTVSKPLKFFEHILQSSTGFYRPHRSHIFNIKYLKKYVKRDGNYVVLDNEHIIPVSKDKREEFLNLISSI